MCSNAETALLTLRLQEQRGTDPPVLAPSAIPCVSQAEVSSFSEQPWAVQGKESLKRSQEAPEGGMGNWSEAVSPRQETSFPSCLQKL